MAGGFETCVGLGGDAFVLARDIVLDATGRALVVGFTADPNLLTTMGTFSVSPLMGEDAFLMRMNAAGTGVDAGTCFGGAGEDFTNGVALDDSGNVYITGRGGVGYPIIGGGAAFGDAVATRLDGALATVQFSTVLGYSEGFGIAVEWISRRHRAEHDSVPGDAVGQYRCLDHRASTR